MEGKCMMHSPLRYTPLAVTLHWLMAALIFVTVPLGFYMQGLPLSPDKLQLYSFHKWIGITLLALAMLRAGWRLTHAPPPLPAVVPRWQRRVSAGVHGAFYVLLFCVPLSGWLMSSAKGFQTVWFGVLPLPDLVDKNRELGETLALLHQTLNFALLGLVSVHVAAVVQHHRREGLPFLQRMGWALRARTGRKEAE
jgi:cytochrome b561